MCGSGSLGEAKPGVHRPLACISGAQALRGFWVQDLGLEFLDCRRSDMEVHKMAPLKLGYCTLGTLQGDYINKHIYIYVYICVYVYTDIKD